jgi:hypothetical protein
VDRNQRRDGKDALKRIEALTVLQVEIEDHCGNGQPAAVIAQSPPPRLDGVEEFEP